MVPACPPVSLRSRGIHRSERMSGISSEVQIKLDIAGTFALTATKVAGKKKRVATVMTCIEVVCREVLSDIICICSLFFWAYSASLVLIWSLLCCKALSYYGTSVSQPRSISYDSSTTTSWLLTKDTPCSRLAARHFSCLERVSSIFEMEAISLKNSSITALQASISLNSVAARLS